MLVKDDQDLCQKIKELLASHALEQCHLLEVKIHKEVDIFTYKVEKCARLYCNEQELCHFFHSDADRRRDPREGKSLRYFNAMCYTMKDRQTCVAGDKCYGCHSKYEKLLHPLQFKKDVCSKRKCKGFRTNYLCPYYHPHTPDSFYGSAWKDLLVVGNVEQSVDFLCGAIRSLYRLPSITSTPIFFVSPSNDFLELVSQSLKRLAEIHDVRISLIRNSSKMASSLDKSAVIMGTPENLWFIMSDKTWKIYSGLRVLILDDIKTILDTPQIYLHFSGLLKSIHLHKAPDDPLSIVATCEKYHEKMLVTAAEVLKCKLKVVGDSSKDSSISQRYVKRENEKPSKVEEKGNAVYRKRRSKSQSVGGESEDGSRSSSELSRVETPVEADCSIPVVCERADCVTPSPTQHASIMCESHSTCDTEDSRMDVAAVLKSDIPQHRSARVRVPEEPDSGCSSEAESDTRLNAKSAPEMPFPRTPTLETLGGSSPEEELDVKSIPLPHEKHSPLKITIKAPLTPRDVLCKAVGAEGDEQHCSKTTVDKNTKSTPPMPMCTESVKKHPHDNDGARPESPFFNSLLSNKCSSQGGKSNLPSRSYGQDSGERVAASHKQRSFRLRSSTSENPDSSENGDEGPMAQKETASIVRGLRNDERKHLLKREREEWRKHNDLYSKYRTLELHHPVYEKLLGEFLNNFEKKFGREDRKMMKNTWKKFWLQFLREERRRKWKEIRLKLVNNIKNEACKRQREYVIVDSSLKKHNMVEEEPCVVLEDSDDCLLNVSHRGKETDVSAMETSVLESDQLCASPVETSAAHEYIKEQVRYFSDISSDTCESDTEPLSSDAHKHRVRTASSELKATYGRKTVGRGCKRSHQDGIRYCPSAKMMKTRQVKTNTNVKLKTAASEVPVKANSSASEGKLFLTSRITLMSQMCKAKSSLSSLLKLGDHLGYFKDALCLLIGMINNISVEEFKSVMTDEDILLLLDVVDIRLRSLHQMEPLLKTTINTAFENLQVLYKVCVESQAK